MTGIEKRERREKKISGTPSLEHIHLTLSGTRARNSPAKFDCAPALERIKN
jgi:hypothetical protein